MAFPFRWKDIAIAAGFCQVRDIRQYISCGDGKHSRPVMPESLFGDTIAPWKDSPSTGPYQDSAWGSASPTLFFTGLGLALASVSHTAYLIAGGIILPRGARFGSIVSFGGFTRPQSATWKSVVAAGLGLVIVATLPEVLRWVERQ